MFYVGVAFLNVMKKYIKIPFIFNAINREKTTYPKKTLKNKKKKKRFRISGKYIFFAILGENYAGKW